MNNILKQVQLAFPSEEDCIKHLEKTRWNGQPACPYCNSLKSTSLGEPYRYHCLTCKTSYSVTTRTLFHRTHIPLIKWFQVIALTLNSDDHFSIREISKALNINKNTVWRITNQINKALWQPQGREILTQILKREEIHKEISHDVNPT